MRALSLEQHERQFLQNLKELASEYLIPLVFDEACTGFRLAMGGAQEYYSVVPDLSVFTKALGGGYPIGAIAGSIELMNLLDRSISTGSYHANALSATAALATLNELEKPGTFERLNAYGNRLREGLFEVFKSNGIDAQMTGVGSIVEFFFTPDAVIDYPSARRSDLRLKQLLGQYLPRHGVVGSGGMYVSSTCHGDTELSLMLDGVRASLQEIADAEGF
jgi:glutamate-1-semialdehyde 2,1-aminomutase